jgi:hypothetical protein
VPIRLPLLLVPFLLLLPIHNRHSLAIRHLCQQTLSLDRERGSARRARATLWENDPRVDERALEPRDEAIAAVASFWDRLFLARLEGRLCWLSGEWEVVWK